MLGVLEVMVCVCLDHLVTGVHAPTHVSPPTQSHNSPYAAPPSSPHTCTYSLLTHVLNAKPDEEEHTNLNVGTHNIAIGGTLG